MAKLKALRLAREATEPPRRDPGEKTARQITEKRVPAGKKAPALSDWLAGQQNGGRRT